MCSAILAMYRVAANSKQYRRLNGKLETWQIGGNRPWRAAESHFMMPADDAV